MPLRSLPLTFNLPHVDVLAVPRQDDATFKKTIAVFQRSTLGAVMATATHSLHEYGERNMTPALQHVQRTLQVASRQDVVLAVDALQQLTRRADTHTALALDVLEGFGAVGLHKSASLAPPVRELVAALARVTHGEDLHFVMEVAADVPGARKEMDAVGHAIEPELRRTLDAAQSPRTAAQQGDQAKMMALVNKNRTIDYRGLIHDAALWGNWLGPSNALVGAARRAHQEMFPGYVYPHDATPDPVRAMFDDGFVRGRN